MVEIANVTTDFLFEAVSLGLSILVAERKTYMPRLKRKGYYGLLFRKSVSEHLRHGLQKMENHAVQ